MNRADQIHEQLASLLARQEQATMAANQIMLQYAHDPDNSRLNDALKHFAEAEALKPGIAVLQHALESAETADKQDAESTIKAATAADMARAVEIAAVDRVKAAALADKAFNALAQALRTVSSSTPEISSHVHRCVQTHRLSPMRRGEQLGMLRSHASHDGPAFAFAVAQSLMRVLSESGYLDAMQTLVDFKIDPTLAKATLADAARISAEGLRVRLNHLPTDI